MKHQLVSQDIQKASDSILVFAFEGDKRDIISDLIKSGDFEGKDSQLSILYGKSPMRIMAMGLGKKEKFTQNKFRSAVASVINVARLSGIKDLTIEIIDEKFGADKLCLAALEGASLALHRYEQKSEKVESKLVSINYNVKNLTPKLKTDFSNCQIVIEAIKRTRDLINEPATTRTPQKIAEVSKALAKGKCDIEIFDKKDLQKMGANAILAVAASSVNEPRMIVLDYNPPKAKKTIALVGKGITFDSGGLDLKPAAYMETMKHDMSGAAVVLNTVIAASELKLPIRIIGTLAVTENLISSTAYKPGDIIKTMSGKMIEILNTDAEGRVVLSDALHYTQKTYKPSIVIDLATLTGACVVALGPEAAGIMGNDKELIQALISSGDETYERLWELPMWDEYAEYIKSDFADIKNVVSNSGGPGAGTITAAKFLENFIQKDVKWAHLDIAGTSWAEADKNYKPKGATGYGVRLLIDYLKKLN